MKVFERSLEYGRAGESAISRWLQQNKGFAILPAYEKLIDSDRKGPQLFFGQTGLIAPDLLAIRPNGGGALWVEVKRKNAFAWNRKHQCWTTGLDIRVYEHYQKVQEVSGWPVVVLFLHEGGVAKDSPPSPAGLYARKLSYLVEHELERWAPNGMVYWRKADLLLIADRDSIALDSHCAGHQ